jgi:hypothetical protein
LEPRQKFIHWKFPFLGICISYKFLHFCFLFLYLIFTNDIKIYFPYLSLSRVDYCSIFLFTLGYSYIATKVLTFREQNLLLIKNIFPHHQSCVTYSASLALNRIFFLRIHVVGMYLVPVSSTPNRPLHKALFFSSVSTDGAGLSSISREAIITGSSVTAHFCNTNGKINRFNTH